MMSAHEHPPTIPDYRTGRRDRRRRGVPHRAAEPVAFIFGHCRRAAHLRHPPRDRAPGPGPPVSGSTFAEAEKLAQVTMTQPERDMAAASWQRTMAPLLERR